MSPTPMSADALQLFIAAVRQDPDLQQVMGTAAAADVELATCKSMHAFQSPLWVLVRGQ